MIKLFRHIRKDQVTENPPSAKASVGKKTDN